MKKYGRFILLLLSHCARRISLTKKIPTNTWKFSADLLCVCGSSRVKKKKSKREIFICPRLVCVCSQYDMNKLYYDNIELDAEKCFAAKIKLKATKRKFKQEIEFILTVYSHFFFIISCTLVKRVLV